MEKWKKYSRNLLERVKIVSSKHSSKVNCLNCGRILRSEPILCTNDELYQFCPCGYKNYFTLVGDYLWEVSLVAIKRKEPNTKDKRAKQLKFQF